MEAYGWYSHFLADEGDILIACSGITVDKFHEKVTVLKEEHLPLCMNTSTMRFKVTLKHLLHSYLIHFLRSRDFKDQIGGKATGSAQLNFGPSHVNSVNINLPPIKEQNRIATILSDMDTDIAALESKLSKTQHIKQGMMQNLLTGRIRLVDSEEKIRESA
ncbi:MAG: restriction endonuclease subunit S [Proteobacteria bacterium]|nr:restriction endonuclease subunit S [Pseudomonadota bacterium]